MQAYEIYQLAAAKGPPDVCSGGGGGGAVVPPESNQRPARGRGAPAMDAAAGLRPGILYVVLSRQAQTRGRCLCSRIAKLICVFP